MMSTMRTNFVNFTTSTCANDVDDAWFKACYSSDEESVESCNSSTSSTSNSWADCDDEMDFSVLPDLGEDNLPIALLNKAAQQNDTSIFDDAPEEPVEGDNPFAKYLFNPEASVFVPKVRKTTTRKKATKVFTNGQPRNGHPEFTIFVKGFSYQVSADDLELFFSAAGCVTKVAAPKDSRGRSRRIAWITFEDEQAFHRGLEMHGQKLTRTLSGKTIDCTLRIAEATSNARRR